MTKMARCLFNGQQFCMCQGTMFRFPSIVPSPDYFAVVNDDSTHRNLTTGSALVSLIQRYTHVAGISERVIERLFYQDQ